MSQDAPQKPLTDEEREKMNKVFMDKELAKGRPLTKTLPIPPYVFFIDGKYLPKQSERVTEITPEIIKDVNAMAMALKHFYADGFTNGRRGFAIAHAQINVRPWAFFVSFDVDALERLQSGAVVKIDPYFNPEIIEFGGRKRSQWELCLSFPFHGKAKVDRWEKVKVRWQDEKMEWHEKWLEGKFAQVWQHEMEHLLGGTIYGAPMW